jgi:GMP synthase (glutamine-hydrolysing)
MNLHWLQHAPFEDLGAIEYWCRQNNIQTTQHRVYQWDIHTLNFPDLTQVDGLIIMGGPMNVDEHTEYPWLVAEKAFIAAAIAANKPILGICLGAQLIAASQGAKITRNPHTEIGWFAIEKTKAHPIITTWAEKITTFHWHGDTFALPENATRLFRSAACENQGFILNTHNNINHNNINKNINKNINHNLVIGLQFHPEITADCVEHMIAFCGHELTVIEPNSVPNIANQYIQNAEQLRAGAINFAATQNQLLFDLLPILFKTNII